MRHMKSKSGRHQRLTGIVLGAALSASPALAHALGLGRLVVKSGLNEPLSAYVRIIDATPSDIKTLSPSLAPEVVFKAAGVGRHRFLSRIKYTVRQHKDGHYYIDLSTDEPFREPFIQTLLEVDWAGGQLVREYTALLDPPHWVASQHPAISAPIVNSAPAATAPASATALPPSPAVASSAPQQQTPAPATPATPAPATASSPSALLGPAQRQTTAPVPQFPAAEARSARAPGRPSSWANTTQFSVRRGDTLTKIARKVTVDHRISPDQVMIALLQANPDAFFNHNINNLITGKILKVPGRRKVLSVSRAQALKDFRVQYDAWQEYKLRLAAASHAMRTAGGSAQGAQSGARAAANAPVAAKPKAASNATGAQPGSAGAAHGSAGEALLSIVRSELNAESTGGGNSKSAGPATKKTATGERAALSNSMTTVEEQLDARQQENKQLRKRAGKMSKQVQNTKRLINVENRELALAEKQAATPKAAPVKPIVRHPLARPMIRPFVPPPPQSEGLIAGVLGSIFGNTQTLAMLGGVVVLGAGILAMYYLRRRRATAEFEESILSGGSLAADASSVTDSGSQAAASDTSFLSDFSQGGMGNIHTDEVDPIAEAEVYLAYGRDEQAEEILKEAIVKDPQRQELKQKLLEIYMQRNDVVAFETLAEELYAQTEGNGGRVWEKVEEMGRKISPGNPMFRGGVSSSKPVEATGQMETLAGMSRNTGPIVADAALSAMDSAQHRQDRAALASDAGGIDFMTAGAAVPAFAAAATDHVAPASAGGVSFDMDLAADTDAAPVADAPQLSGAMPAAAGDNDFSLDFDLDSAPASGSSEARGINIDTAVPAENEVAIDFGNLTEAPRADEGIAFTADEGVDSPGMEFESADEGGAEGQSQWDETTTKLDLAKAYIDMGDSEGARSILDEVISEGNETQKNQARMLAAQIA
ncbi:MAG: FimV/HubP family polar landmark protein [Acidiferrobacterales bacterium]